MLDIKLSNVLLFNHKKYLNLVGPAIISYLLVFLYDIEILMGWDVFQNLFSGDNVKYEIIDFIILVPIIYVFLEVLFVIPLFKKVFEIIISIFIKIWDVLFIVNFMSNNKEELIPAEQYQNQIIRYVHGNSLAFSNEDILVNEVKVLLHDKYKSQYFQHIEWHETVQKLLNHLVIIIFLCSIYLYVNLEAICYINFVIILLVAFLIYNSMC